MLLCRASSTPANCVFFSPADTSSSSGISVEERPLSPQAADENSRGSLKGGDDPDAAEKACITSQDEKGEEFRS